MRDARICASTATFEREEAWRVWRCMGRTCSGDSAVAREEASLASCLHPDLPYIGAEVVWAAREEMARTVDDALSRRTRALLLNARAAVEIAPAVARIMDGRVGTRAGLD